MATKPFLEFNMLDFEEPLIEKLKKFSKASFNLGGILAAASELKYTRAIKLILAEQWSNPSYGFVRFFASQVRSGQITKAVMQRFNPITKSAFHQFVDERISDRLKSALAGEQAAILEQKPQEQQTSLDTTDQEGQEQRDIITTAEDREGYYIVKTILREVVAAKRVSLRDHKSYSSILLDNTNRKPLCRLYLDSPKKHLGLFDEQKHEKLVPIDGLDDIYKYADQLKATVGYYESGSSTGEM